MVGDVGAADDGAIDVELVVDHSGDQTKTTVLIVIDSLDARDGVRVRTYVVLDLVLNSGEELNVREGREKEYLMRNAENQAIRVLHTSHEVRTRDDVFREFESMQIRGIKEISIRVNIGYFTFSCSELIISDSLRSPIISSYTHILISFSKQSYFLAFLPIIMERAEALCSNDTRFLPVSTSNDSYTISCFSAGDRLFAQHLVRNDFTHTELL